MRNAERTVLVLITLALVGGVYWGYSAVEDRRTAFRDRVAAGEFQQYETTAATSTTTPDDPQEWRRYYPMTYVMSVSDVSVHASVADTLSERIKGLSNTPYLPDNVVKLFAFGVPGSHSIWMKDMNYPIDILWADAVGTIVHIEEAVSPNTYDAAAPQNSQSFRSPVDAWYVVETNAGFVAAHEIVVGDTIVLPQAET